MRRVHFLFLGAALAAAFLWPLSVRAHVPEVGEEKLTYSVCNGKAARDIFATAKERGSGATALPAHKHERAGNCRIFPVTLKGEPTVLVRVLSTAEPAYTPDNYMVYMAQVELVEGDLPGGPWFAFHRHKVEDEAI